MYAQNGPPSASRGRQLSQPIPTFQPNQEAIMQVLSKYRQFIQQIAYANKNLGTAYKIPPNFQNYSFAKQNSLLPYTPFGTYRRTSNRNINNVIKGHARTQSLSNPESTQVIFQRQNLQDTASTANYGAVRQPVKEIFTKRTVNKNTELSISGVKAGNVQSIVPPKDVRPLVQVFKPKPPIVKKKSQNSTKSFRSQNERASRAYSDHIRRKSSKSVAPKPVIEVFEQVQVKKKHAHPVEVQILPKEAPKQIEQKETITPVNKQNFDKNPPVSNATTRLANPQNINIPEVPKQIAQKQKETVLPPSKQDTTKNPRDAKSKDTIWYTSRPSEDNVNKDSDEYSNEIVVEELELNEEDENKNATQAQVKNKAASLTIQENKSPVLSEQEKKEKSSDTTEAPKKIDQVTEIFKRCPINRNPKNKPKVTSSAPVKSTELDFQQVTQELANIIKNFQLQILDKSLKHEPMEQVPSAMIKPKVKQFFKTPPPNSANSNNQNKNTTNTSENNANSKNHSSGGSKNESPSTSSIKKRRSNCSNNRSISESINKCVSKQSSLKSFSGSHCKMGDIRRYNSFTHNNSSASTISTGPSSLGVDPLRQLKEEVQRAIRDRKTFTVCGGSNYEPIRRSLLARGWVEKFHPSYKNRLKDELKKYMNYSVGELLPLVRRSDLNNVCQKLIKSKLMGNYQVDFFWGYGNIAWKVNSDKIKLTLMNRMKRDIFYYTTKEGLCEANKNSYWFQKEHLAKLNHPRTYSLGRNGDLPGFTEDFHITAAMSLLKWVVKMHETKECKLLTPIGKIPLETFDFALNECCKLIKKGRHEDIDVTIPAATDQEWNQFLDYFYKLVHYNNHFKNEGKETEESLVRKSNYAIKNLKDFYPHIDMDGMMNMWILKPIAGDRGRGIHICRTFQYILKTVQERSNSRYVIQKYIERPLLIYNTKFDVRQWFLVSNCDPLTVWMYRECYLRFSSETYNLRKLHESIHLTNNSVQRKYRSPSLDTALPRYNMWDCEEFQKYLSDIGYPNAFKDIIYPGMKQCILAALLIHQERLIVRKNTFEMYGADFMLTEDFQPWLIEINGGPAMFKTTPVTTKMCPKALEDVIKVVIDYAQNNKASTGSFEMIYKQPLTKVAETASFELKGKPLKKTYFCNNTREENNPLTTYEKTIKVIDHTQDTLKTFGEDIKRTLTSLLQIIEKKRELEKDQDSLKAS